MCSSLQGRSSSLQGGLQGGLALYLMGDLRFDLNRLGLEPLGDLWYGLGLEPLGDLWYGLGLEPLGDLWYGLGLEPLGDLWYGLGLEPLGDL